MAKKTAKKEYISLVEASKASPYSQEYLSLRARQGKLKALKIGRDWMTTKNWLEDYLKGVRISREEKAGSQNEYLSLQEASKTSPYSQEYLSLRVRQGKLRAVKIGRNWMTTPNWLKEYSQQVKNYKQRCQAISQRADGALKAAGPVKIGAAAKPTQFFFPFGEAPGAGKAKFNQVKKISREINNLIMSWGSRLELAVFNLKAKVIPLWLRFKILEEELRVWQIAPGLSRPSIKYLRGALLALILLASGFFLAQANVQSKLHQGFAAAFAKMGEAIARSPEIISAEISSSYAAGENAPAALKNLAADFLKDWRASGQILVRGGRSFYSVNQKSAAKLNWQIQQSAILLVEKLKQQPDKIISSFEVLSDEMADLPSVVSAVWQKNVQRTQNSFASLGVNFGDKLFAAQENLIEWPAMLKNLYANLSEKNEKAKNQLSRALARASISLAVKTDKARQKFINLPSLAYDFYSRWGDRAGDKIVDVQEISSQNLNYLLFRSPTRIGELADKLRLALLEKADAGGGKIRFGFLAFEAGAENFSRQISRQSSRAFNGALAFLDSLSYYRQLSPEIGSLFESRLAVEQPSASPSRPPSEISLSAGNLAELAKLRQELEQLKQTPFIIREITKETQTQTTKQIQAIQKVEQITQLLPPGSYVTLTDLNSLESRLDVLVSRSQTASQNYVVNNFYSQAPSQRIDFLSNPTIGQGATFESGNVRFTTSGAIYQSGAGQVTFSGNVDALAGLDVTGNLTVSGVSTLTGSLVSSVDNAQDLGSQTSRWRSLYLGPEALKIYNTNDANAEYLTIGFSSDVATLNISKDNAGAFRPLAINQNGGEVLRITNGNVGIGTTSPYAKLSVVGPVVAEYFSATSTIATTTLAGMLDVGSGKLVVLSNGNIGIGTSSPLTKLSIQGTAGANNVLNVASSTGASMLYVNSAGNMGIGTAGPLQKLHVEGQCVTGDTELSIVESKAISNFQFLISNQIPIPNDQIKKTRIDEIKGGEYVLSLNEKTGKLVPAKIKGLLDMGVRPIYRITTEDGRTIKTTGNHPYLVKGSSSVPSGNIFQSSDPNTISCPRNSFSESLDSNLEKEVDKEIALCCGICSQTTEKICDLVYSQKSESLVTNTRCSLSENKDKYLSDAPGGAFLTSQPVESNKSKSSARTFSSSNSLGLSVDDDIVFFGDSSGVIKGGREVSFSQGRESFKNTGESFPAGKYLQNLPDHNSGAFESGFAVADSRIGDNIFIDSDGHKNEINNYSTDNYKQSLSSLREITRRVKIGSLSQNKSLLSFYLTANYSNNENGLSTPLEVLISDCFTKNQSCKADSQAKNYNTTASAELLTGSNTQWTKATQGVVLSDSEGSHSNTNELRDAKWTRVAELQKGDEIAVTADSSLSQREVGRDLNPPQPSFTKEGEKEGVKFVKIAKIELLSPEQVYDIEVEGTHNFVANGILAHNTYISGNVGIGTTSPYSLLSISNSVSTAANTPLFTIASTTAGTATSTLLTVLANGQVVIGGGAPLSSSYILTINGSIYNNSTIQSGSTIFGQRLDALQLGVASRVAFSYYNDETTGMYFPVAGQIGFSVGGTERVRLDASGNVGIGTTTPSAELHIKGNTSTAITGSGNVTATNGSTAVTGSGTTFTTDFVVGDAMKIGTSTTVYTISSITSDTALVLTANYTGSNGTTLAAYKDPNNLFAIDNGLNTNRLTITRAGLVGIGTTTPYSLLSISNSATTPVNTPLFTIASTTAGTATSTLLTVLASGNVGIGIANPTSQLTQQSTLTFESAPLGAELTDDTGWTAPSDQWTGSYANGFNHVATTTASNLIRTVTISSGAYYQISFAISNNTAGSFTVALGSATSTQALSAGTATTTLTWAPKTASAIGNLAFIPTAAFVGRISAISVKQITGTYSPTYALLDTAGNAVIEMRSASSTLLNTFIGVNSGAYNVTGTSSTAVGNNALAFNTSGSSNSAIGTNALYNNITGSYNSAVGNNALLSNTTGYQNSAMGYQALYKNTTGYYNSAMGANALSANTTGISNSAMGVYALSVNTTGYANSAMGYQALYKNTTGYYNSAMGANALSANTTGISNSAMGSYALTGNTTGYSNSAMGYASFYANRLGSGNSVFGYQAGYGVNNATNLTASSTIIGYQAGYSLGSTTANILIGYQAGYSLAGGTISSGSGSNNIVIGFNTDLPSTTQNSTLDIGNLIYATGLTNFASPSSAVSAGNVGIGTSSPLTTLSIQGTAGANDVLNVASSTGASMLYVNAAGNVGIGTTSPSLTFAVNGTAGGTNAWTSMSYSGLKENFADVAVLAKIDNLNIKEWQYKPSFSPNDTFRHLSPFAEDFRQQFGLGDSDYTIQSLDVAGVALKGVQEIGQIIDLKNATSTSPSIYIDGLGNVGIGLTADLRGFVPQARLDIRGLAGSLGDIFNVASSSGESFFKINALGSIGLGTSTPAADSGIKLAVGGDIAATGFVNLSTREAKKDIEYLTTADYQQVLAKIASTSVATYLYANEVCDKSQIPNPNFQTNSNIQNSNIQNGGCAKRLGLIAEEAPREILSADAKGVDLYKMASFTLAGVKALNSQFVSYKLKVDSLEARIEALENNPPTPLLKGGEGGLSLKGGAEGLRMALETLSGEKIEFSQNSIIALTNNLFSVVLSGFKNLGLIVEQGVVRAQKLIADTLQINKLTINAAPASENGQPKDPTIGSSQINIGENNTYIMNNQVSTTTKIFVTPELPVALGVCEQNAEQNPPSPRFRESEAGQPSLKGGSDTPPLGGAGGDLGVRPQGFRVCMNATSSQIVKFNWWIVETTIDNNQQSTVNSGNPPQPPFIKGGESPDAVVGDGRILPSVVPSVSPSVSPTPTPTITPTPMPSVSPEATATPSVTATPSPEATPSPSPSASPEASPSSLPEPAASEIPSPTPSSSATPSPSVSPEPSP